MNFKCSYNLIKDVADLKPHPANRNKHDSNQVRALAKIIAKVGQRSPIVVSKQSGYIVKGHGRLEAIKLLGWPQCAVDVQDYESELEELNDRIADNEIARYSEFDKSGFLNDLREFDFNVDEIDMEEFGLINFEIPEEKKEEKDYSENNKEVDTENFGEELENVCPRCGFEFESKDD